MDAIIEGLAITLPLTSLSEVCEVKDGTHDSPRYVDDGIPFVTQKNIREDGLSFEKVRFISHDDHSKFYKRSNVARGDILISMIGANRGMACIVDDARVFSIKNVGLIKKSDNVDQGYLLAYLKSTRATAYVAEASRGGAQEFIGLTALRKFPIVLPPLVEQTILSKRFHELRDQIGNVTEAYDQKLSSLRELKSALLAKAFSGRLASKCSLSEAAE